jgi:hypothetical protein
VFRKATFMPAADLKVAFLNSGFTKVAFLNLRRAEFLAAVFLPAEGRNVAAL